MEKKKQPDLPCMGVFRNHGAHRTRCVHANIPETKLSLSPAHGQGQQKKHTGHVGLNG